MSSINNANFHAPDRLDTAALERASSTRADAPTSEAPTPLPDARLHDVASSGDVNAMIAALLVETGQAARESAKMARDAAAKSEDAAHAAKIDHMETAATWKLVGGIVGGTSKIGAGGAEIGGALGRSAPLQASSKGLEGAGDVGKAFADFAAAGEDLEVAHADRALTQAKRHVEASTEADSDAKDLIRRAMSAYADYVRGKEDATKAALFRA